MNSITAGTVDGGSPDTASIQIFVLFFSLYQRTRVITYEFFNFLSCKFSNKQTTHCESSTNDYFTRLYEKAFWMKWNNVFRIITSPCVLTSYRQSSSNFAFVSALVGNTQFLRRKHLHTTFYYYALNRVCVGCLLRVLKVSRNIL